MRAPASRSATRIIALVTALLVVPIVHAPAAQARSQPVVTRLSAHRGIYWGGSRLTVFGENFVDVTGVLIGTRHAYDVDVTSPTRLTVSEPSSRIGTFAVRVVTASGRSAKVAADEFTYRYPTMDTPIFGGLTARQEIRISARVRAAHRNVPSAPWSRRWTPAMGHSAARRAHSWLGLPYSWAGGDGSGPTLGVCAHNGGDLDCHVDGFDCSGLALFSWWPYEHLPHYAAYQHTVAGRFRPRLGQLVSGDLVFFAGYVPNGIGHVAIYTGHGMVIEAAEPGTLVRRARLADLLAHDGDYRGATRPMSNGIRAPGPQLSSITPQLPVTGGTVTIAGRRLDETTTVSIAGRTIYRFVRQSATRLVVTAPAHAAGRVGVAVSNPWRTATTSIAYVAAPS